MKPVTKQTQPFMKRDEGFRTMGRIWILEIGLVELNALKTKFRRISKFVSID